ncbi:MAG: YraN family protein [Eggerthellaceae bacterium]|nr:YraN family protein [Eggerthellaceae bacterium]
MEEAVLDKVSGGEAAPPQRNAKRAASSASSTRVARAESSASPQKAPSKKRTPAKRKTSKAPQAENHNQELGARGERAAVNFLQRKGFEILDKNWKCSVGEVDIVAEEGDTLVFVEVKTRANCEHGFPEEAVHKDKRRRYEKIVGFYLQSHDFCDKQIRFDVIAILVVAPERAFLRHHRNAFSAGE